MADTHTNWENANTLTPFLTSNDTPGAPQLNNSLTEEFQNKKQISLETGSTDHFETVESKEQSNLRLITLNIGGKKHQILWKNLIKYPQTRLGQLTNCYSENEILKICDCYFPPKDEFFFDHSPRSILSILNIYRRGKIHLDEDVCILDFAEDMKFWGVNELHLDSCCQLKFLKKREEIHEDVSKQLEFVKSLEEDEFGFGCCSKIRKYIWNLFEKTDTIPQKIIAFISISTVLVSIAGLLMNSLPESYEMECVNENVTYCDSVLSGMQNNSFSDDFVYLENRFLATTEEVSILYFTLEYIIRFLVCPNKIKFFQRWLNNIDLLAIAPYYISLFFFINPNITYNTTTRTLEQFFRLVRVLRIFKLSRYSVGLRGLGFTLKNSYKNVGVLLLFISIGLLCFSTIIYIAEREDNPVFDSIPGSFYWSLVTMGIIGVGEVNTVTSMGKFISMIAGFCGVIVVALPIPIVVDSFALFYQEQREREKALKRQKSLEGLKANWGSECKQQVA